MLMDRCVRSYRPAAEVLQTIATEIAVARLVQFRALCTPLNVFSSRVDAAGIYAIVRNEIGTLLTCFAPRNFQMLLTALLFRLTFATRIRLDVVMCQTLGIVVTAFAVRIEELAAELDYTALECISHHGFLCSLESLLSTVGEITTPLATSMPLLITLIRCSFSRSLPFRSCARSHTPPHTRPLISIIVLC